ncbi:tol-pal system YbgF family protein [Flavobacterium sp.]|uniref:tol-pal system YbgF family protein n=1 Tax=Flavobacterium sp. TaxID=239 RepID=UPI0037C0CBDA
MKNIIIPIFFLFSTISFGQKKNSNEDLILFEKTVAIQELLNDELSQFINPKDTIDMDYEEKIKSQIAIEIKENVLEKVIQNYTELISEYPKSKLIFRALNNKGFAELELEYYGEAEKTFLKILNSDANDKEKGGIGSGLMGEPYANYKNRACKILADLELKKENFTNALKYLDTTKKYPYQHFCGNEFASEEIYMAEMYSKCYLGLNQYDKAYDILLPNIIENGLASNSELIEITFNALLKNYKKEDLKSQFENSFKNVIAQKETRNKNEYTYYYINFLNRKIELSSWKLNEMLNEQEREKITAEIQNNSGFYKLLIK